jgi:hypothetical protein
MDRQKQDNQTYFDLIFQDMHQIFQQQKHQVK